MKSTYKILCISIGLMLFFVPNVSLGQNTNHQASIHELIQKRTNQIYDSLVHIRRQLHQYPELSGQEKQTAKFIADYLSELGLEVKTNIGGYGVVGILNTEKRGKKIAWRVDIDALPMEAAESFSFVSKNKGVNHMCGHDVHTAIGLGIANVLATYRDNIEGTVYFIFQPSEENYKGAKAMITDGLLDIIKPDEIYAVHISPMPSGLVASKANYLYADYKQLNITFTSAKPTKPLIDYTKQAISDLQNVSPDSKFWDTRNLMDLKIGLGNPNTIFQNYITVSNNFETKINEDKLTVSAFISTSSKEKMDSILFLIRKKIKESEYADQLEEVNFASDKFVFSPDRANVQNHDSITLQSLNTISDIYGKSSAFPLHGVIPDGRGDDFAYFQEKIPGVYFLLGGSNYEKGVIAMPHAPNFAVDETCIQSGVEYFSSMIIERINQSQ
ncbi:amidohydrolase [Porifericola rhodea]|uniref:M20 metallopeptidase family protein n=1 Tax=Porifericola rhodea TaxID=930972 RepID=UPI0026669414|nr:amidohydrolase [Porifericola rhodea]WKN31000.1 amidohydrolase [Porifericola rhodea]